MSHETTPPAASEQHAKFRLLRLPEVKHVTGLSTSQIYRLQSTADFPTAVRLSPTRVVCWSAEDIHRWVQDRIDAAKQKRGAAT